MTTHWLPCVPQLECQRLLQLNAFYLHEWSLWIWAEHERGKVGKRKRYEQLLYIHAIRNKSTCILPMVHMCCVRTSTHSAFERQNVACELCGCCCLLKYLFHFCGSISCIRSRTMKQQNLYRVIWIIVLKYISAYFVWVVCVADSAMLVAPANTHTHISHTGLGKLPHLFHIL